MVLDMMDRDSLITCILLETKPLTANGKIESVTTDERDSSTVIQIVPANRKSASLTFTVGRYDSEFEVEVGKHMTFDGFEIPDATLDFINDFCQAVFEGRILERTRFVGQNPVETKAELALRARTFSYHRKQMLAFGGKAKDITYAPY